MSASPLVARTLTAEEIPALCTVVFRAFNNDATPERIESIRELCEPDRTHGVFDGDELIGGGVMLNRQMTLPGAGQHPVAAVSSVGVAPDQHRRGALTALMRAQLHSQHE